MNPDAHGLHEIANTLTKERLIDVIFVHGLGGASHTTWSFGKSGDADHFFWPEVLGKERPNCGIWTLGYPAGLTMFGPKGMLIEKRALNIAQTLVNNGIGDRPIIFIVHSLGGLIIKSLIVAGSTLSDKEIDQIVRSTVGIVFCSTPHRGSDYSNAAGIIFSIFGGAQDHLNEMKSASDTLDLLHDKFINWQNKSYVSVRSYAENIGIFRKRKLMRPVPLGVVVNRASANPGIVGHVVKDLDEDHLSIVKPRSKRHDIYVGVLRFIDDIASTVYVRNNLTKPLAEVEQFLKNDLMKSL